MKKNELKSCPFCGGKAIYKTSSNSFTNNEVGFNFEIKCADCKIRFPKLYEVKFRLTEDGEINPFCDERRQAAEEWNKRI